MQTLRIIETTDNKFIGKSVTISNDTANINNEFYFTVIEHSNNRIVGKNYSLTYQIIEE